MAGGRRVWKRLAIFLSIIIVAAIAVYWFSTIQIYHLATVQQGVLYRDGNRGMRELKHDISFTQAKTVISLIDDQELNDPKKPQFKDESGYCVYNGVQYIRIPVKLGGWPSSEDVKTFLDIAKNPINQPILLHCAQGVRRTGMFVAAYQESVLHLSPQQAKDRILSFGHRKSDTEDVRKFIDVYDPVSASVPVMNQAGSE